MVDVVPRFLQQWSHARIHWTYYCTYCCCTFARTAPTDEPVHVCTYLLYLVLYLLYARVLYLLLSSTYYVLTYVRTALLMYVRIYIYRKKGAMLQIGTYCTYILYARTAPIILMYVLHVPTIDARTYDEEKNYQLLQIRAYCGTHVPTALTWYSCTYWCTYAPTAHTAVPTGARTYPPYVLL